MHAFTHVVEAKVVRLVNANSQRAAGFMIDSGKSSSPTAARRPTDTQRRPDRRAPRAPIRLP